MLTTHSPSPREAGPATRFAGTAAPRRATAEPTPLDPSVWQQILATVRSHHPSLNRVWFDQMVPRQLTNGVIQVTVATPAQLFVAPAQDDYHLSATSPALEAGEARADVPADLEGVARPQGAGTDVGAYERRVAAADPIFDDGFD